MAVTSMVTDVNIAARLASLGGACGICVIGWCATRCYKIDFCSMRGAQGLRTIGRPVRVYRIRPGRSAGDKIGEAQPRLRQDKP